MYRGRLGSHPRCPPHTAEVTAQNRVRSLTSQACQIDQRLRKQEKTRKSLIASQNKAQPQGFLKLSHHQPAAHQQCHGQATTAVPGCAFQQSEILKRRSAGSASRMNSLIYNKLRSDPRTPGCPERWPQAPSFQFASCTARRTVY